MKRKLVLENGIEFYGESFGSCNDKLAEIVFNTSMVGYQEILSDPSYCDQIVVMSYPLIGNYGLADEDYESKNIFLNGFVVREYCDIPSNFRSTKTLGEEMEDCNVSGISGIDTRMLVRIIRNNGSMKALITNAERPLEECMNEINSFTLPRNQVSKVTCKKPWIARTRNPKLSVVAIDCGIKLNIVRKLNKFGCNVTVVPYNTPTEEILKYHPDGLFISNGPGDPQDVPCVYKTIQDLKGKVAILGICLGHQIIALAYGAKTYKMKFGHRGANHPVRNEQTKKIEITSQNHSYAIDSSSLANTDLVVTHTNIIDGEIEGVEDINNRVIGIQYHPESAAGPEDSEYIFSKFVNYMKEAK